MYKTLDKNIIKLIRGKLNDPAELGLSENREHETKCDLSNNSEIIKNIEDMTDIKAGDIITCKYFDEDTKVLKVLSDQIIASNPVILDGEEKTAVDITFSYNNEMDFEEIILNAYDEAVETLILYNLITERDYEEIRVKLRKDYTLKEKFFERAIVYLSAALVYEYFGNKKDANKMSKTSWNAEQGMSISGEHGNITIAKRYRAKTKELLKQGKFYKNLKIPVY